MTQDPLEYLWLDNGQTVTLTELSSCCAMSVAELDELVDYCALVPLSAASQERVFSAEWVAPLREAGKLRVDFDLDLFTVAILLGNLKCIEVLELQVQQLQALLPARLQPGPRALDARQ
ncbi:MAG: chaperone modulator CbpM [Rhodoferax sp.]|uniref:chaperone modulator CbpM n=1 Tax=Rhodoferax sp. TaxID=50421 RepID=UPI00262D0451|nr:chaperone modulator CbpM [Rhodoferax sp.]MDD5336533.1 chaperone modulator CbpM [Rhodoferax sp.]